MQTGDDFEEEYAGQMPNPILILPVVLKRTQYPVTRSGIQQILFVSFLSCINCNEL